MLSDDSDISPSRKSIISSVEISESPPRKRQILPNFDFVLPKFHFVLPNFDFVLPKFHFILPNFYFVPPWGIFVCHVEIPDFLGRRVTGVGKLFMRFAELKIRPECL